MKDIRGLLAFIASVNIMTDINALDRPAKFNPECMNPKEAPRPKNHKRFFIHGVEIWALSEQRAYDKYWKNAQKVWSG
jgi:hypothetical protein